jgi:hypothetical protein
MPYYVVGPDGRETGPVGLDELVSWVRAGQLPRTAPVRDEGSARPVPAGEMIELASYFPAAPAPSGSAIMPTENPDALWGYYLGWVSLLCLVGLAAAPYAFVRSRRGLKKYNANPAVHGKAHAIVGLVLTGIGTLANLALLAVFIASMLQ